MVKLLDKCSISSNLINIILLQIQPGRQNQILEDLANHASVYEGLGRYDLILMDERRDLSLIRDLRTKCLDAIIDFAVLAGFKWVPKDVQEKVFQNKMPFLGLCCIRLSMKEISGTSIVSFEQEIVREIHKLNSDSINISVYGGLGWHQLICLIHTSSIELLPSTVHDIKRLIPKIVDITTIPCLDFSIIEAGELDDLPDEVKATIMFDLEGFSSEFPESCEKKLGDKGFSIFGLHDYIVNYRGKVSTLAKAIRNLRSDMSNIIRTTSTIIGHEPGSFEWQPPSQSTHLSNRTTIKEIKKKVKSYQPRNQREVEDLIYFCNLFELSLNDQKTEDMFPRLASLLENLLSLYEQAIELENLGNLDGYRRYMETFYFVIDCIRMAYQQRHSGVLLGNLLAGKSLNIGSVGFSLRVINAVETIPFHLLQRMNLNWAGFCVFSYYGTFYRMPLGIIGFPSTSMYNIEEFWGAFHESGHEIFSQLNRFDSPLLVELKKKRNTLVEAWRNQSIIRGHKESFVEDTGIDEHIDSIIGEVFSDVVDYHLGFQDNWKLYSRTIWNYVKKKFSLDEGYVARMLFLFLLLGPGKNHKTSNINRVLDKAIEDLKSIPGTKLSEEVVKKAKYTVTQIHTYDIDSEIVRIIYKNSKNGEESATDLEKLRTIFNKGVPVSKVTPTTIINALLIEPIKDYTCCLAALMSLYDLYGKYFLS